MITQSQLKELLHYNTDTGHFTWIENYFKTKIGKRAGAINNKGYRVIGIRGKVYKEHRLAWLYTTGILPNHIDHINHVRDDNRFSNFRNVTNHENRFNLTRRSDNSTGVTGISIENGKYLARIGVNFKSIRLGLFDTLDEAKDVRKIAEQKHGFHNNHGKEKGKTK